MFHFRKSISFRVLDGQALRATNHFPRRAEQWPSRIIHLQLRIHQSPWEALEHRPILEFGLRRLYALIHVEMASRQTTVYPSRAHAWAEIEPILEVTPSQPLHSPSVADTITKYMMLHKNAFKLPVMKFLTPLTIMVITFWFVFIIVRIRVRIRVESRTQRFMPFKHNFRPERLLVVAIVVILHRLQLSNEGIEFESAVFNFRCLTSVVLSLLSYPNSTCKTGGVEIETINHTTLSISKHAYLCTFKDVLNISNFTFYWIPIERIKTK